MIDNVWERPVPGNTLILRWNHKMHALRKHLSGWASHIVGILKTEKLRVSTIIDELGAYVEVRPLTSMEVDLKSQYNAQLAGLLREEELKWYLVLKAQFILEGDSNTRYFHGIINGRHTKKRIEP
jgi:hypothetical protein